MKIFLIITTAVLLIVLLLVSFKLFLIKRNIRDISAELQKNMDGNYDRKLKVILSDKDTEMLAARINESLDYQKKLKTEAEESRDQLKKSISDIAHDLRTPLTVIIGNLKILSGNVTGKDREYVSSCEKKAANLKAMVDEFFELSLIESGDEKANLTDTDIIVFLSDFFIGSESVIRQHNLTPDINFPEKSVIIKADKKMLTRVLENLMNNIYKYAKDSFSVSVTDSPYEKHIVFRNKIRQGEIIDTDHIFDRTYRADKARTDGSAGLGLYIVKLLVEKMNGTITASVSDGELMFDMKW